MAVLHLLLRIASRNLWLYRAKTITIGALLAFGAFLVAFGLSILTDVESAMRNSIVGSVAGHLQVYSSEAKDELALFGGTFMGREDVGSVPDFEKLAATAMKVPNVAHVVPMGMDMAILSRGNELDETFDGLRDALKVGGPGVEDKVANARLQIGYIGQELEGKATVVDDPAIKGQLVDVAEATSDAFWPKVKDEATREAALQWLETKIAPLSGEKTPVYLRYLGTDLGTYPQLFPKFKMKEGERLPPGKRGIMISHKTREDWLKNMAARLFDKLHKRVVRAGVPIKGDPENERLAADLERQYMQVLVFLDRTESEALAPKLEQYLGKKAPLAEQLQAMLKVDDASFLDRYRWFYANVAPLIRLYEISVGETITLRAYTRSGYLKSLPLKVYGVYSFEGLEDSDVAGAFNITDIVSFRELYGQMSAESLAELKAMKEQSQVKEVSRDDAEAALFGESATVESRRDEPAPVAADATLTAKRVLGDSFPVDEPTRGLVLNAAVLLKDDKKLAETQKELDDALKGAGLVTKVVDWRTASGIVGQFVAIIGGVLIFAVAIILLVALVIINSTMVVATMARAREIGTMRAVGAQRSFVVGLFILETALTALVGAVAGALLAAGILAWAGAKGLPATNDFMAFLFSGPRFFPNVHWSYIVVAPVVITGLAAAASMYAARFAARIDPAVAMQEAE